MIGASVYIIVCTARNRLRVRLRRLREPRYLLGAIVGAAYFYFSIFGRFRAQRAGAARRRGPSTVITTSVLAAAGPALGGLALMIVTALSWVLPFDSGLLEFSKPEVQFLFPAPVSRRGLLLHRMLRSQVGMLFGALIIGIVTPSAGGYARLRMAVGMWLVLCTSKVYFTGVTLVRTRLVASEARIRRIAWLPLGVLTLVLAGVLFRLTRTFLDQPVEGVRDAVMRIGTVATTGVTSILMAPFMAVVWPLFAAWPQPYFIALGASAAVLAGCVVWVLQVDGTFQEAAMEAADRKASAPTAKGASYRARATGIRLAASGRDEMIFAWKAAMQTFRVTDRRTMARLVAMLVAVTIMTSAMGRGNGFAVAFGLFAMIGAMFAILMAPQALRIDIRQDLQHLELLKTWPVAASAVVRGEMLWPGVLLTAGAWLLLAMATFLSAAVFSRSSLVLRLSIGSAVAIMAPGLIFAQLVIHNGVALMFPAWVPQGQQRARGLDAMGQRLIMLGGTWLLLVLMALPAAIAAAIIWFVLAWIVGSLAFVPAAVVGAAVLAIEVLVASEMLGPLYEKLDLLAVERPE